MKTYSLYTDGAISNNGDKNGTGIMEGGIGWLLLDENGEDIAYGRGFYPSTLPPEEPVTNNRMELSAAIAALGHVPAAAVVDLYTDSQYLKNAFTKQWLAGWKRKGWKTAAGSEVKNQDLWRQLDELFSSRTVRFHWVKGHVGVEHNE